MTLLPFAALLLAADPFASPCLGSSAPSSGAAIYEMMGRAEWSETEAGPLEEGPDSALLVCVDGLDGRLPRSRVWVLWAGVASWRWVPTIWLSKVPASSWRAWRWPEGEAGQTGCLRRFKKGTKLFDAPDGEAVAVVVDREAYLGKWENRKTASGHWGGVRGVRSKLVWVRQPSDGDWCD